MNTMDRILDKCVRSGAQMAEVYDISQKRMSITVRDGKVETIEKSTPGGVAIRYYSFDRSSFAHSTDTSDAVIDKMIARMSSLTKKISKDENAVLPEPGQYPSNLDIFAPSFTDISTESKIDYLTELEQIALRYDPLITNSNGIRYTETVSTKSIANSNGVNASYDSTFYQVSVNLVASKNSEMFPGEMEFSARHFEDLPKPDEMVDKAAGQAIRLLGGTPVDAGDYEIIFTPSGAGSILWGLNFALNGEDFIKGSSFLAGKEGQKFADSKLFVFDDATMPRGVSSRPFDAEGTASMKNILIENGVLKNELYDMKTAARAGVKSTGSASRRNFSDLPGIWPSNFYIVAGSDKVDDVVSSCSKGIIVEITQGWGLNSISGMYSAGINGTLIRNGKKIKPVANVTLGASTDELFNGIGAVCDDLTFYQSFNSPTIMIKKMKVGA
jgi:PmbA protein